MYRIVAAMVLVAGINAGCSSTPKVVVIHDPAPTVPAVQGLSTPAAVTAPTPPEAATPAPTSATPPPVHPTNALALNGKPCHDLLAQGYSFAQAVQVYHDRHEPPAMDADHNGIPCETVYPAQAVRDYYGSSYGENPYDSGGYVSGLTCAQLRAQGFSYPEAVSYWYSEGKPARLDADQDGQPCETVYTAREVQAYGD